MVKENRDRIKTFVGDLKTDIGLTLDKSMTYFGYLKESKSLHQNESAHSHAKNSKYVDILKTDNSDYGDNSDLLDLITSMSDDGESYETQPNTEVKISAKEQDTPTVTSHKESSIDSYKQELLSKIEKRISFARENHYSEIRVCAFSVVTSTVSKTSVEVLKEDSRYPLVEEICREIQDRGYLARVVLVGEGETLQECVLKIALNKFLDDDLGAYQVGPKI